VQGPKLDLDGLGKGADSRLKAERERRDGYISFARAAATARRRGYACDLARAVGALCMCRPEATVLFPFRHRHTE
jgi:hypothetical protein